MSHRLRVSHQEIPFMNAEPASVPGDGPSGFGEPAVIKTNQHTELRDGMPVSPQPS